MSTTLSNVGNAVVYVITLGLATTADFIENNWAALVMITFGAIHVYIALSKNAREKREAEYKVKDRELLIARADERLRQEEELRIAAKDKQNEELRIEEFEKKRNRDASNTRADLYCEKPEKRRTSLMTINGGKNE